jgi:hypothetical protein
MAQERLRSSAFQGDNALGRGWKGGLRCSLEEFSAKKYKPKITEDLLTVRYRWLVRLCQRLARATLKERTESHEWHNDTDSNLGCGWCDTVAALAAPPAP